MQCAESPIPVLPNGFECAPRRRRPPKAMGQALSIIHVLSGAQREDNFSFLAFREIEWHLDRRTGIQTGPHSSGKSRAYHRGRTRKHAVASQKFSPVTADCMRRITCVEERNAITEFRAVWIAREER